MCLLIVRAQEVLSYLFCGTEIFPLKLGTVVVFPDASCQLAEEKFTACPEARWIIQEGSMVFVENGIHGEFTTIQTQISHCQKIAN